jgi:DHA1 family bicyclomycin/chloramphenicol resistance-like MFS transporter
VGAIAFIALLALPETLKQKQVGALSVRMILDSFRIVARHPVWRVYACIQAVGHTGLFTFVAASPFVLQNVYKLTPIEFGAGFSACSVAFVSGAALGSRLVGRRGLEGVVALGVACLAGAGVLQLAGYLLMPQSVLALFLPELLYFLGIGLTLPHAIAGGMSPFPDRAGAASSLQGFLQMSFSAGVGVLVVALLRDTALPLALTTLLMGGSAFAIFHLAPKARRIAR